MNKGASELVLLLGEIKQQVERNPCGMGDNALSALANALRVVYRSKFPKKYSRDQAAKALGVSTRTLSRLVKDTGIKPYRDGFKNVYFLDDDINSLRKSTT